MGAEDGRTALTTDAENPLEGVRTRSFEVNPECEHQDQSSVAEDPRWQRMDWLTKLAVNLATFAYLPLQVPQIVKNFEAKSSTDLSGLQWQGYTTGALGNLLLCTYFASVREWAAVRVQAIGSITNFAVVVQIWHAGYCPQIPFFVFLVIIGIGLVIPLLKALALPQKIFSAWQEATTAIGLGALLALIGSTIDPNNDLVLYIPFLVGVLVMLVVLMVRPARLMPFVGKLSGWLATYLFMFMPVPQVIENFIHHEKAASFAGIGFAVLAAIGNGLCTSRALFTKDAIWFTGAIWGTIVGGWLTAMSVYFAGYLGLLPFILYSVGLFAYLAAMFGMNGHALRESAFKQVAFVFF